jgi:hypothetical protein
MAISASGISTAIRGRGSPRVCRDPPTRTLPDFRLCSGLPISIHPIASGRSFPLPFSRGAAPPGI